MLVNVHVDDSEEAVDSRKQEVAARFGLSDDEVDRYLLAYHDDEAAAHSKMATSSVSQHLNVIHSVIACAL